jgi:dipeptidase
MCDTIIASGETTKDGAMIFGKNSDREPNEAQYVVAFAAADHPSARQVKCTNIEIPQAKHTFAILLAKPFWIWGAEMGANEHGLVIDNEAVFTKRPYTRKGLLGMNLLRLAFERNQLKRKFASNAFGAQNSNVKSRAELTTNYFIRAESAEKCWLERIRDVPLRENLVHFSAWAAFNREAKIPQESLFMEA